ncbi:MAG TPA: ATP-binding protein [Puia sp.]|nr:ATP-binding protein [Puia sp.]
MKQLIIFLLLFISVFGEAQSQQNTADSLHAALQNAVNDTIRMDALSNLGYYYFNSKTDSFNFYLAQGLSIARKLNLKLYEAGILSSLSYHFSWSDYPKALELAQQALKIVEDPASEKTAWHLAPGRTPHMERMSTLGYTYFNTAQLYGNTGNIEKQISSLRQVTNIAGSIGDSALNMLSALNLGTAYLDKLKKLDSALYFEQRALNFFSASNGDASSVGWIFGSIGAVYLEKGNFGLSRDAFQKGLQWMQQQNNLAGIGSLCLSLSKLYRINDKSDSSLLYAYKALNAYNMFKDRSGIANAWSSLSSAYEEQKRTDSAYACLKLATALHDSLNNVEKDNLLAYQNKNFDEQMRIKNLEEEKIQTRTKIRTYAMLAGIIGFMVITLLLYRNSRHRKKANELLQVQKEEIEKQKKNVEGTLTELKSTQSQLIQSEKMASLGELTAGIAHEIQNPLNFVNNFSDVNKELLAEMKDEIKKGNLDEVTAIANNVIDNEEKINHHGKRADAIVKGMLQHSRSGVGVKQPTDINALADEYFRLSYHGLRAKDKQFNAELKTDFDPAIDKVNIVPQDIGRVLLNLFNNAFYAVNEKKKLSPDSYEPFIKVSTKKMAGNIEIKVADNGSGIPQNVINKIFQPFFTTKPTGQGTGLGLSMSYDIVTKEHNGTINVESSESGTTFIIQLPLH